VEPAQGAGLRLQAWAGRHPALAFAGFTAAYAVAAWVGRSSRLPGTTSSFVWPATAVGVLWLASSWSVRPRRRLAVLVLAAVTAAVNGLTGAPAALCALFALANVLQAAVTCACLHRRRPQPWSLRAPSDLTALLLACAAGTVAGLVGPVGMALLDEAPLLSTAPGWALRTGSSTVLLVALALRLLDGERLDERPGAASPSGARTRSRRGRTAEALLTAALNVTAYSLVFGLAQRLPLTFALLPLGLWLALRWSPTVAAGHGVLVGVFVVVQTLAGNGPFAVAVAEPGTRAALAQLYVCTSGLVALSLALYREERARLHARLRRLARDAGAQAALLDTVLGTIDVGIVACDADGHLTLFNAATRELHGMPEDPALDPADWAEHYDLLAEDGATPLRVHEVPLVRALAGEQVRDSVIVIAPKGRAPRVVRCDGDRLRAADGRVLGAVVAMKDITDARRAEQELQEREQRFRAAFHDSPTPIAYLELTGVVREVNPALRRLLAVTSARVVHTPLERLAHPGDRALLRAALEGEGTGSEGVEVRVLRADGTPLWCQLTTTRTAGPADRPYLLAQLVDVHARKTQELALEAAARRDLLTGLANRTALHSRLSAALTATDTAPASTTLLFLDLDGFKTVNDEHGHEAGDAVLVEVATRLRSAVRPDDLVARLGGDEFVLLCPGLDEAGAAALVERVEQAVGVPVAHQGWLHSVSVSVGTAVGRPGQDPTAVLDAADRSMYRRKKQRRTSQGPPTAPGRSRSAAADPDLALTVATALAEDRLHLAYQPAHDLRTGAVVGAEALLRMRDRDGRVLTPDVVVPVAEAHGHINAIGRWVVRQALTQGAQWKRRLPPGRDFLIGVNMSTLQMNDPELLEHVQRVLHATGISPSAVGLEITESRLLPDTPGVQQTVKALHELGLRVTVDDFGSGYANLGYLATFPFDALKIDRAYTQALTQDGPAGRLAAGVFALARTTGMVVVAEGIETVEERDAVLEHGCTLGQGFLWSRPGTADELWRRLVAASPVPAPRTERVRSTLRG
jgi:diguanylate cyclase (GGDEF)-like protein/PAS domain S-box-containing protein